MIRTLLTLTSGLLAAALLIPASAGQETSVPRELGAPQQGAAPRPFLWKIEKGAASGYLLGTIHLPDDRALDVPPSVSAAFEASGAFYAEIETTPETELEVQRAALLPSGQQLDRMVGAATWGRIEARLAAAGLQPAFAAGMKRMKPWALGATLPMLGYLPEMSAGKPPLDKLLFLRAQQAKKVVGGLETSAEQISAFEVFSEAEHVRMLEDALDELDRYEADGRDLMEETLLAWLSGDPERLLALMESGFGQDPELRERAAASLLWSRNLRMAERIDERMLAERCSFFAVGALHLPDAPLERPAEGASPATDRALVPPTFDAGEGHRAPKLGLVTLLRQRGYEVRRILR